MLFFFKLSKIIFTVDLLLIQNHNFPNSLNFISNLLSKRTVSELVLAGGLTMKSTCALLLTVITANSLPGYEMLRNSMHKVNPSSLKESVEGFTQMIVKIELKTLGTA